MLLYLQEERDAGRPVSNETLMEKARALAQGVEGVDPEFKASAGWFQRNNVGIRRGMIEAQKLPEDYGVVQNLQIPSNIRLVATRNGWMTGANIQDWVARIWGPNTDDARRLLILDQARIHTMQTTKDLIATLDTDLMFVPAGRWVHVNCTTGGRQLEQAL